MRQPEMTSTDVGQLLDRAWQLKRGLASRVTSDQIDDWYSRARESGAKGGKLCGAGGGGFLSVPGRAQLPRLGSKRPG